MLGIVNGAGKGLNGRNEACEKEGMERDDRGRSQRSKTQTVQEMYILYEIANKQCSIWYMRIFSHGRTQTWL